MNQAPETLTPWRAVQLWRDYGDRVVIISDTLMRLEVIQLDEVGGTIWKLIDGERSATAIATELRTQIENEPPPLAKIIADTVAFLNGLRARKLIFWREESFD